MSSGVWSSGMCQVPTSLIMRDSSGSICPADGNGSWTVLPTMRLVDCSPATPASRLRPRRPLACRRRNAPARRPDLSRTVVFPSVQFAVFFPVVLGVSWALMPHRVAWKLFVLAASYAFYAAADPRFCLLLAGVTLTNQAGAVLIGRTSSERARNRILGATVAADLLALGFFKYYGFFVD